MTAKRFIQDDLFIRAEWAGFDVSTVKRLLKDHGQRHLDELVDCLWIIGHYRSLHHGDMPEGTTFKEWARNALEGFPVIKAKLDKKTLRFLEANP